MVKCAVEQVSPGDILLFHVGPSSTPVALPVILQELSARGYHFVTVQELILFGPPASYGAARLCDEYYL
jgi:peptidoglycan/xylan/chitin deacetylase (PgdA/CDA1 family)